MGRKSILLSTAAIIVVLTLSGSTLVAGVNQGLISHWKFDEGAGSIAYDSAGTNDGTIYGATWATGQFGGALSFDGTDDCVDIPDADVFDFGNGDLTICVWYKTNDTVDRHGPFLIDFRQNDNDPHIEIYVHAGVLGTHLLPNYTRMTDGFVADDQ